MGQWAVWISWVDDCLNAGPTELVEESTKQAKSLLEYKYFGNMVEYVGCKMEHIRNEGYTKLIQPVLLQSFEDEFNLKDGGHTPRTPSETGQVLSKGELEVSNKEH
eukprot:15366072-Ditylum_brightwellii.AAC.2